MKNTVNNETIIHLLRNEGMMTRQEIAKKLGVSMPTALNNTNELLQLGVLIEDGEMSSTGGRKAKCLRFNKDLKKILGIDIGVNHVKFLITDFCGDFVCEKKVKLKFQDTIAWYESLTDKLNEFFMECSIDSKDILCAGLSFPGIIDEEKEVIVKSHILGAEHVGLDRFKKAIDFPLTVNNDANCAAFAEISQEKTNYLYLSLNDSVGGGLVLNASMHIGDSLQAGEIGHMILVPGGKQCYCGKKGCADPYLSPTVLLKEEETLSDFFGRVSAGDEVALKKWDQYLEYLAIFITNLRMVLDIDIVIGGEVGKFIDPYMDVLKSEMQKYDLFARTIDYVYPCSEKHSVCAMGAARLALSQFELLVLNGKSEE
ncbi:MAG: ROK family transcriptional regulator [Lachnospiraceae bacterium]|nr:ROK family transcriptional regulator [Lachnospiraceae bacterium]